MTEPGTLYVRLIEGGQWKDVGHVSQDGVTYLDREYRSLLDRPIDLSSLSEAARSVTLAFKTTASAFRILGGLPLLRRTDRTSRLRSAYRQKRGRRRFR